MNAEVGSVAWVQEQVMGLFLPTGESVPIGTLYERAEQIGLNEYQLDRTLANLVQAGRLYEGRHPRTKRRWYSNTKGIVT